ncbi:MAG: acyl--CoA ligase [Burkholderiales bacterium]|nr:acyl--CoA ligase [Burkholderiales bacterium]
MKSGTPRPVTSGIPGVLTIRTAIERACRWFADRPALIEGARSVSYQQFDDAIRRIARGYWELGLRHGDRITFLCAATIEHALAFYAAHRIGAITVNLHLRETVSNQVKLFQRLQPKILVFDDDKADLAAQIERSSPSLRLVGLGERRSEVVTLAEIGGAPDTGADVLVHEHDPAIIQLSSGSTGLPKALVHSNASVLESWTGGLYMWSGIAPEDRFLNAFSPSFVVWLVHPGSFLNHGSAVVLQSKWDPAAFLESVQRLRVTCVALTSTQWRGVLAVACERYDLRSLRMAAYLGEKMAPDKLQELRERVCPAFCSFYGMSECLGIGGCVIRSVDFIERGKWGSVGKPSINSDLRISEPGAPLVVEKPPLEVGEVIVRAASFAMFNWGDPAWQDRVLTTDGWFRTGDLGHLDTEGYLFLSGRADHQIATGGIKVAPEEVEQVLDTHPGIAAVAVLGVNDEQWGQRIVAVVVRRDESVGADSLDAWCRSEGRLAGYKCPKEWLFVDGLPQTSVGKLDRRALQKLVIDARGMP